MKRKETDVCAYFLTRKGTKHYPQCVLFFLWSDVFRRSFWQKMYMIFEILTINYSCLSCVVKPIIFSWMILQNLNSISKFIIAFSNNLDILKTIWTFQHDMDMFTEELIDVHHVSVVPPNIFHFWIPQQHSIFVIHYEAIPLANIQIVSIPDVIWKHVNYRNLSLIDC